MVNELKLLKDHFDWTRIQSVMYYPKNADKRLEVETKWILRQSLEKKKPDDKVEVDASLLIALLHSPSLEEVQKAAKEQANKGSVAGYLLYVHAKLNQHGENPSARKTVKLASNRFNTASYKKLIGTTEPTIWRYKEEFEPVQHLWAARVFIELNPDQFNAVPVSKEFLSTGIPWNDAELKLFLSSPL